MNVSVAHQFLIGKSFICLFFFMLCDYLTWDEIHRFSYYLWYYEFEMANLFL